MNTIKKTILLIFLSLCFTAVSAQQYIFYLHGRIVENQGPEAVDKVNGYGSYEYYTILDSLKQKNFTVISEVRPKDTQVKDYALKVKAQIDSLLKNNVKPANITVIGASKGSVIAMLVSTYVKNRSVNYVLMAACGDSEMEDKLGLDLYGNILSIYEKTDGPGSCAGLKQRSKGIDHYKEIEINTGLRHGFLYKALNEWIVPAKAWARNNYK